MLHHSIGVNLLKIPLKPLNLNQLPIISQTFTNNKTKTKTKINLDLGIINNKMSTISVTNLVALTLVETLKTKAVGEDNNNNLLLLNKVVSNGVNMLNLNLLLHLVIT